jgi:hypothetical protein
MKRTAAVAYAAVLATLIAAWCALAWQTAHPRNAPDWYASPSGETDDFVYRVVCRAYHHPDWDVAPPGETTPLFAGRLARLTAKERATDDVIAGRRSLLEAAAAFREWDALPPRLTPETGPAERSGDGPEERYCRSVIWWVRYQAPREQAADLTRRLEEELEERLRDGSLQLPSPTDE